jgi:HlyD family secretion protein
VGRVRRIEPAGFTKTSALGVEEQRVWVLVEFAEPLEVRQRLGDAYRVEARIVIWEGDDVLKVPVGALFPHNGGGKAVFVAAEGKAVLRPVRIGHSNGLEAEVLEGLAEGEQVVLHPGDKIKDGSAIAPR